MDLLRSRAGAGIDLAQIADIWRNKKKKYLKRRSAFKWGGMCIFA